MLVGRREGRSDELDSLLEAAGFEPVAVPLIEILPPSDSEALRHAVTRLASGAFDGVAFTSIPAVDAVLSIASTLGITTPVAERTLVAAVGPGTAAALAAARVEVSLVPASGGSAVALADAWPSAGALADAWPSAGALAGAWPSAVPPGHVWPSGGRGSVLLPRSEIADRTLPDALRAKGFHVVTVVAYRTVERPIPAGVAAELAAGEFAAVVVTSGSGARSLARHTVSPDTAVVAIGDATAAVAAAAGLQVAAVAAEPTPAGLVLAVRAAIDVRTASPGQGPTSRAAGAPGPTDRFRPTDAVPSAPGGPGSTHQQK